MYYVYIVRASDDSLYSGITTDLERRVRERNSEKVGSKYLRSKRPVTLVYSETQVNRSAALRREAELKKLNKQAKERLVAK